MRLDDALSSHTDLFLAALNDERSGAGAGTSTALGMRRTVQAAVVDARDPHGAGTGVSASRRSCAARDITRMPYQRLARAEKPASVRV